MGIISLQQSQTILGKEREPGSAAIIQLNPFIDVNDRPADIYDGNWNKCANEINDWLDKNPLDRITMQFTLPENISDTLGVEFAGSALQFAQAWINQTRGNLQKSEIYPDEKGVYTICIHNSVSPNLVSLTSSSSGRDAQKYFHESLDVRIDTACATSDVWLFCHPSKIRFAAEYVRLPLSYLPIISFSYGGKRLSGYHGYDDEKGSYRVIESEEMEAIWENNTNDVADFKPDEFFQS
jgi:hypothetical protein